MNKFINDVMKEAFAKAEVNKEVKEKKERDKRVAQEKEESRKNKKEKQQEKQKRKEEAEQKAAERRKRNVDINHKMNKEVKEERDKKLLGFKRSFLASKYVESYFSDMDVIMHPRMEISLDKKDINYEMSIEHQKESTFVRAIDKVASGYKRYGVQGVVDKAIEDRHFAFEGKSCLDFITVKMNQNLQGINGNIDLEEQIFTELKKGIFIASKDTKFKYCREEDIKNTIKEGWIIKEYKFLGVTPSGIAQRAFIFLVSGIFDENGNYNKIPDSFAREVLNEASGNCYGKYFLDKNDEFIVSEKESDIYKLAIRQMLGYPSCKEVAYVKNAIIFDNMAEDASFTNEDGKVVKIDSCLDGTSFTNDSLFKGINIPTFYLAGKVFQSRNKGALKASSQIKSQRDLVILAKAIVNRHKGGLKGLINENKIEIIYEDRRYSSSEVTPELFDNVLKDIEMIGDNNCFKMKGDTGFALTALKLGHESQSSMNSVLIAMMQACDIERTNKFLFESSKKYICSQFRQIGINVILDDEGNVIEIEIDNSVKKSNNSQMINWLLDSVEDIDLIAPQLRKTAINNMMQSIKNKISYLNFPIDCKYSAIEADIAPVVCGQRLLAFDECYMPSYEADIRLIGIRHPVSTINSMMKFKNVSLEEIFNRIDSLRCKGLIKKFLKNFFAKAQDYTIIPASKDCQNVTDGCDFDMDAFILIKEPEVVDILWDRDIVMPYIDEDRKVDKDNGTLFKYDCHEEAHRLLINKGEDPLMSLIMADNIAKDKEADAKRTVTTSAKKISSNWSKFKTSKNSKALNNSSFSSAPEDIFSIIKKQMQTENEPIGKISTNMYQLCNILSTLRDTEVSSAYKKKIAAVFKFELDCSGESDYISPLTDLIHISEEGHKIIELSKEVSGKVYRAFLNSNGSVKSVTAYITDIVTMLNRFAGETSIDAAKKAYVIYNIFKMTHVIVSYGSDKTMVCENHSASDNLIRDIVEGFKEKGIKINGDNIYDVNLLDMTQKSRTALADLNDCSVKQIKQIIEALHEERRKGNAGKPITFNGKKISKFVVTDSLFRIKENLVNFTNELVVLVMDELLAKVMADDAKEKRAKVMDKAFNVAGGVKNAEKFLRVFDSTNVSIIQIETILRGNSRDIEETKEEQQKRYSNVSYYKKAAIDKIRNTAYCVLSDFIDPNNILSPKAQIGLFLFAYLANKFELGMKQEIKAVPGINNKFLDIFEECIRAYLFETGKEYRNFSKIETALDGNKLLKFAELEGKNVSIYESFGATADGILVSVADKHITCEGEVVFENGNAYVAYTNEITINPDAGIMLGAKTNDENSFLAEEMLDDRKAFTHGVMRNINGAAGKNTVVATDRDGNDVYAIQVYCHQIFEDVLTGSEVNILSHADGEEGEEKLSAVITASNEEITDLIQDCLDYLDGNIKKEDTVNVSYEDEDADFFSNSSESFAAEETEDNAEEEAAVENNTEDEEDYGDEEDGFFDMDSIDWNL
ncbi:MAG: hypothetical protein MR346_09335 [Clostridium sp.]|nr:hypothetical protein [Clostridium sp.]